MVNTKFKVGDLVQRVKGGVNNGNGVEDRRYAIMKVGDIDEVVELHNDGFSFALKNYGSGHSAANYILFNEWDI